VRTVACATSRLRRSHNRPRARAPARKLLQLAQHYSSSRSTSFSWDRPQRSGCSASNAAADRSQGAAAAAAVPRARWTACSSRTYSRRQLARSRPYGASDAATEAAPTRLRGLSGAEPCCNLRRDLVPQGGRQAAGTASASISTASATSPFPTFLRGEAAARSPPRGKGVHPQVATPRADLPRGRSPMGAATPCVHPPYERIRSDAPGSAPAEGDEDGPTPTLL
jgi:hypothetical protein